MTEARLVEGEGGWREPQGEGWYVLNARDAKWQENELGFYCNFEGDTPFAEFGFNISHLPPGAPMAMYHHEPHQEGFLVLDGEALLIVEGEERPLRRWDYVHVPRDVPHVIVAVGTGAVVLAAGGRTGEKGVFYPAEPVAAKHGAAAAADTDQAREAYARFGQLVNSGYRGGFLPD
jgi:uncharacterized cupin superfamily protein